MCPSRQDPASDESVAAVADALDALAMLRRGRGLPGPGGPWMRGPGGRGRGPGGGEADGPGPFGGGGRGGWPQGGPHDAESGDGEHRGHGPHGRGPGGRGRMMAVHRALAVLAASDEPMSITDLGAAIGIDQPRASRVVQMLQHEGLVRREPDPSDARRTRIVVTSRGRGHADEHRERRAAPVAEALATLDEAERRQLATLLARVVEAWPRA